MSFDFALTGAAGFVAPRHMKAIFDTDNNLVVALDPHDSVGIIDRFFPECDFFTEYERFDRHLEKLKRSGNAIDYMSVCSPSYLHDAHCRMGMRVGADVVCEKPLVLKPWNLDQLSEIEMETDKKVYVVLQLRLHPELVKIKEKFKNTKKIHNVKIKYITKRGRWYFRSWKGNIEKSGGLITNIGIHLFDLVIWLFGNVQDYKLTNNLDNLVSGNLVLKNANVEWFLSVDENDLPDNYSVSYRSITVDGEPLKFDAGFTDLHTEVYKDVLNGKGFGIEDARPAIELVHKLRSL